MKINNTNQYPPAFGARIVNNKSLRILIKDIKFLYGDDYIRAAAKQIKKLGSDKDEIKFIYSTWTYQKGLGMDYRKEGVTFALFNEKHMGHFENRFVSNFLSKLKEVASENSMSKKITKSSSVIINKTINNKYLKAKKENSFIKFIKGLFDI